MPLQLALECENGLLPVQLLITSGAAVSTSDHQSVLIDRGAGVIVKGVDLSPLYITAGSRDLKDGLQLVQLLIENGAAIS